MKLKLLLMPVIVTMLMALSACGSTSTPIKITVDSSYSGKEVNVA